MHFILGTPTLASSAAHNLMMTTYSTQLAVVGVNNGVVTTRRWSKWYRSQISSYYSSLLGQPTQMPTHVQTSAPSVIDKALLKAITKEAPKRIHPSSSLRQQRYLLVMSLKKLSSSSSLANDIINWEEFDVGYIKG